MARHPVKPHGRLLLFLLWGGSAVAVAAVALWFLAHDTKPKRAKRALVAAVEEETSPSPQPLFERVAAADASLSATPTKRPATTASQAPSPSALAPNKAQKNDELRRGIRAEARDASWSPESERFLSAVLSDPMFQNGRVRELACGGTRCGFAIDGVSLEKLADRPDTYTDKLREKLFERFRTVRTFTSPIQDGQFDVQVIVARPGYSLLGRDVSQLAHR